MEDIYKPKINKFVDKGSEDKEMLKKRIKIIDNRLNWLENIKKTLERKLLKDL